MTDALRGRLCVPAPRRKRRRTVAKSTGHTSKRSSEFEREVVDHMNMLYAIALRLTHDPSEAQDLTQNTVVKALRFHAGFKEGTYIKAWLLTILRNTFINEYRRKVRGPAFVELTGAEPAAKTTLAAEAAVEPGPSSNDLLELLDDEVREALDSLPEDFRSVVIMADLEDRSYKEIAELAGCPLGTVMSRLHRGRKLLRKQLGAYAQARHLTGEIPE